MTVVDALMSQYSMSLRDSMLFPLEAYLALLPAIVLRLGGKATGPDYCDQASAAARAACKAWLHEHFTILPPGQSGPHNALQKWLAERSTDPDRTAR